MGILQPSFFGERTLSDCLDVVKPGYQKAPVVIYDPVELFPFEDKVFDVSLLITVLHHTQSPQKILLEAKRVTKGRVIVVEDTYHTIMGRWWTSLRDKIYNFEFFGHPEQFKNKNEWQQLFLDCGFKVEFEREVKTVLAGLGILNHLFVLQASNE